MEYPGEQPSDNILFIQNAGLVLLAPFLGPFFRKVGLLEERSFPSDSARERAVLLTQYLATGQTGSGEQLLVLNKLLCGWRPGQVIDRQIDLTDLERTESEDLLQSVIQHWQALGATSVEGFQRSFLQREGKLEAGEGTDQLLVERKGMDVLLEKLPWSIRFIKLAWMIRPLSVEW